MTSCYFISSINEKLGNLSNMKTVLKLKLLFPWLIFVNNCKIFFYYEITVFYNFLQDKYCCPLSWVNMPVFDFKGVLKSTPITLNTWMYNRDSDDYSSMMLKPLGCSCSNPERDHHSITVSFGKYHPSSQVVYPMLSDVRHLCFYHLIYFFNLINN